MNYPDQPALCCCAIMALHGVANVAVQHALTPLPLDADAQVRKAAIFMLAEARNPCAVPALLELLKTQDAAQRLHAATMLGRYGDVRAIAPLLEGMKTCPPEERGAVMYALADIADPRGERVNRHRAPLSPTHRRRHRLGHCRMHWAR